MNPKDIAKMTPEEREAFHQAAEAKMKSFRYETPPPGERPKETTSLLRSDLHGLFVQIVREGGENNLHYHLNVDATWFVLSGRARFYGPGDTLIGEYGKYEGLYIPSGARYWFEKVGEEDLEILRATGIDRRTNDTDARVNVEEHKPWMTAKNLQVYAETTS